MSGPSPEERPTTVIPQPTVEQPAVTIAPATRRARVWHRKVPARIGRARTSTVVIGCLFVLLSAVNSTLPQPDAGTTNVVLPSGQTIPVRNSALPSEARPTTTAPAGTSQAPESTGSSSTSRQTQTTPATTTGGGNQNGGASSAPRTTTGTPTTSSAPTGFDAPTSRAPSSSPAPFTPAPTSSAPTS
jgi:hypothetical protein